MQYDPRPSMPDATTAAPQVFEQPSYSAQPSAAQPHKVSQATLCSAAMEVHHMWVWCIVADSHIS